MKTFLYTILFLQLSLTGYASNYKPKTIYINGVTPKLQWQKTTNGQVPPDAYVAFKNQNGPVYICQAYTSAGVTVGQVQNGECTVADGNKVIKANDFQVLVNKGKIHWLSMRDMYQYYSRKTIGFLATNSLAPQSINTENKFIPVIGGFTYISRYYPEMNYICRGMHDINIVIGSVIRNKCILTHGDEVVDSDMFQILTVKSE